MAESFRQWLEARGARWDGERLADFGDAASELDHLSRGAVVTDLSHDSLLAVSGAEAERFLDGQFTCRIAGRGADEVGLGGYCDPKGRVIAVFRWLRKGDAWLLRAPASIGSVLRRRLELYRLRAAVVIENAAPMVAAIGLAGVSAKQVLGAAGLPVPEPERRVERDATVVAGLPGPRERFEIYACPSQRRELWGRLEAAGARSAGTGCWDLLDQRAGIAWLTEETSGQFIPQMLDLDQIGAVSFEKGCYPGQEVVSRVHHLGGVKRRPALYRLAAGTLPDVGSPVVSAEGGRAAGVVLGASPVPGGAVELLAVVAVDQRTQSLRLERSTEDLLEPLPFER